MEVKLLLRRQLIWSESGCNVRETDLPPVKRAPESFDRDLYNHERQCQHHTSEGRCLVLRHTKTKNGGIGSKDTGWLEADVDMRNEVIIDPSLRLVYKERYKEDACQYYIELD